MRKNYSGFLTLCCAVLVTLVAIEPARAVSVTAIPVTQGQRSFGVGNNGMPFDTLSVVPVGGSNSQEVFGAGVRDRTSSNQYALEFSLAPLLTLEPLRSYTITSAILKVNYAGGSDFSGGAARSPTMLVSGYRDQDGTLTLGDFNSPALFSDSRGGLPPAPPPTLISPQEFDVTSFVQVLYNQQSPFAGFRFDAIGSVNINGFNFSDPTLRPTLTIVAAVPEPAISFMMGLGVAGMSGLAWFRRRRRA